MMPWRTQINDGAWLNQGNLGQRRTSLIQVVLWPARASMHDRDKAASPDRSLPDTLSLLMPSPGDDAGGDGKEPMGAQALAFSLG